MPTYQGDLPAPHLGEGAAPPESGGLSAADALLGRSEAVRELRRKIRRLACTGCGVVLVQGETGTGKELVARALHAESSRRERAFVCVNCSAVPENLLEGEFFGYEAGAYTDARRAKPGLLEIADGGTLFLDEISELGLALQAKLLRVLEDMTFRRLGGTAEVRVDVFVVAATNVDLARAVEAGRFRPDLYYRLSVVPLETPPLRERPEDTVALAEHFLARFNARFHKELQLTPEAFVALQGHAWPGNVRELRNVIERVVLLEEGPRIAAADLHLASVPARGPAVEPFDVERVGDLDDLKLRALIHALERSGGNQSEAARALGVSRDTVRSWMRRYRMRTETRVVVDLPPGGAPPPE